MALAIVVTAISIPLDALYLLVDLADERKWFKPVVQRWLAFLGFYALLLWYTAACCVAAIRTLRLPAPQWTAAMILVIACLSYPLTNIYRDSTLWKAPYDPEAAETLRKSRVLATEDAFYSQPPLLDRQLAALAPGRKGVIDLYFVGVAGYADEDVFMKEVRYVSHLFDTRFGTADRSMVLINNPNTVLQTPIASVTALKRTLLQIGRVMDRDEDILFLFLTSHGSQTHRFSLDFGNMQFHELHPKRLRELLDESGIKRRVIVVSACYSGGFINALKDDLSLVITASAADRNSFGCSNENEFTYFGKAYFNEALSKTDSFITAFELAKPIIAAQEKQENYLQSNPQIFIGTQIREPLAQWMAQLKKTSQPTDTRSSNPSAAHP